LHKDQTLLGKEDFMSSIARTVWIGSFTVSAVAALVTTATSLGYDKYSDGCQNCHGSFLGGTSPQGTIFPEQNKHQDAPR
jgi:mono/diheme cytochrome c family protein